VQWRATRHGIHGIVGIPGNEDPTGTETASEDLAPGD
jgi:hypothetical protein